MTRITTTLLIAILATIAPREASALITGGVGNKPMADPGWPKGAAGIFNHKGRIAWWEGPPFGGGQWHAECRGDAKALNAVLADFAKMDAKTKRIVVHDGVGHSFWLAPNGEPEKLDAAKMDWVFMVWQPANWDRLRQMPADINPTGPSDTTPPSQINVYTANIRWADIDVPKGIAVDDQRLEAHGFTTADGVVMEGHVTDLATKQPIAATIRLQEIEPQQQGGYLYRSVAESKADARGHWVLKKAPTGWFRVVVVADGYVPRVAGHAKFDGQPCWQSYASGLARSALISGRVTDEDGKPLEAVQVRLGNVAPSAGGRYESPDDYTFKTDAQGRFRAESVPAGNATIHLYKPGYFRAGLGLPITTPKDGIELQMSKAAAARITVDFTGVERPEGYIVSIAPEGGERVGKYGGSGNIDAKNRITFENVPPGRYTFRGRPNPGSVNQETEAVTVDLKGGQVTEVTLKAK